MTIEAFGRPLAIKARRSRVLMAWDVGLLLTLLLIVVAL
jgi:uncharacterized integral membrane protein